MLINVAECVRKLHTDFERREAPSALYVRYLLKKVKETGILIDKPKNIAAVADPPSFSTIEHFGDIITTNFA